MMTAAADHSQLLEYVRSHGLEPIGEILKYAYDSTGDRPCGHPRLLVEVTKLLRREKIIGENVHPSGTVLKESPDIVSVCLLVEAKGLKYACVGSLQHKKASEIVLIPVSEVA